MQDAILQGILCQVTSNVATEKYIPQVSEPNTMTRGGKANMGLRILKQEEA